MRHRWLTALSALAVIVPFVAPVMAAPDPGVTFLGFGRVPGTDLDKSRLAGKDICPVNDADACIDQATLGGFGSALAYTDVGNVFLMTPDRGPFDGRTDVP